MGPFVLHHSLHKRSGKNSISKLIHLMGFIRGHSCKILIDGGASSNFISPKWIEKTNSISALFPLKKSLEVKLADGKSYIVNHYLPEASIKIGRYGGVRDFIQLELNDYDAILGMPWLQDCNPT